MIRRTRSGQAALVRGNHIAKIAETINQVRPDIVAINEAHRSTWQSRFRDHVRSCDCGRE